MSILASVRRVRRILMQSMIVRALGWGAAAYLTVLIIAGLADWHVGLSVDLRRGLNVLAGIASVLVMAAFVWRDRAVLHLERVALWIEEHDPRLEYQLVTAIEGRVEPPLPSALGDEWARIANGRLLRNIAAPVVIAVIAFLVSVFASKNAIERITDPRAGDALTRTAPHSATASRLAPLVADIAPPAYSREAPTSVDEPTTIRALAGSRVTLRGRGAAAGVSGATGTTHNPAIARGDQWAMSWTIGPEPTAIRLSDGLGERLVAIEPIVDAAPTVNLDAPAHDTVLRTPEGRIPLSAQANDDFGIASAAFELIISSGEGETFTFRSTTLGATKPNARRATIAATLSLDSLDLKPGDIVHVRAVARDANTVSGPGLGTSETRTLRIARADEGDSVAVDAAGPPDAERSVISERMLIQLAEALDRRRPTLPRPTIVSESRAIAADQAALRRSVSDLVFSRLGGEPSGEEHEDQPRERARTMEELLARADSATTLRGDIIDFEGGESPVVAVNQPLLEAYNAMWDASTQLEVGEPGRALPHMRRALAAIERARQAERIYLRGRPPEVVVDVAKVRLVGKDKGVASTHAPIVATSAAEVARTGRFMRLVELANANATAAADSALMLRIDALADNAPLAAALGDAASALRSGHGPDATNALIRARRALAGAPVLRDSIARWGAVP